jgi:hypothetical protein
VYEGGAVDGRGVFVEIMAGTQEGERTTDTRGEIRGVGREV